MKQMMIACAAALAALTAAAEPETDCGCAKPKPAESCECGAKCACDGAQRSCVGEKDKGPCAKRACPGQKGDCAVKGKGRPRPVALRLTAETSPDEIEAFKRQVLDKIDAVASRSRAGEGEANPPVMITLIVNDRPGKGPRAEGGRPGKGPRAEGGRPGKGPRAEGGRPGKGPRGEGRRRPPRAESGDEAPEMPPPEGDDD